MASDTIPVTGVDELEKHLDELIADPSLPPKTKLFDDLELQLTDTNIPALIPRLLPKITEILKRYEQDPAVLCSLAIKLLGPLNFTQIMSLASEEALIQALESPAASANLLGMEILHKAAKSPSDAAILATMHDVIIVFLAVWLGAPEVRVGEKGSRVLGDLLDVDCDTRSPDGLSLNGTAITLRRPPGQGLMWRRIFNDTQIYNLLLMLVTAAPHDNPSPTITLAQGRLLRILPRLAALNLAAVTRTDFPELNQKYAHIDTDEGLLQFAALHMVDLEDVLMQLNLIDFFETLLSLQRITPFSTYKMETLKKLVRDATAQDSALKTAILTLPDRTVPEEAGELRSFIHHVAQG
ncbi:hypothetical protein BJ170DRAFT_683041 [Xylariales sp. AK1849]|nr:hypothetical protein BJ170DRAFT_683041 [Xylariales sp. AK1849]